MDNQPSKMKIRLFVPLNKRDSSIICNYYIFNDANFSSSDTDFDFIHSKVTDMNLVIVFITKLINHS